MNNNAGLNLKMKSESRIAWNTLLQKGFYLIGQSGMTVRQFMIEIVGYTDSQIEEEVRTVFLNFSPVDDIDTAYVKNDDRLAMGSPMPGLVGICMGRDNPYKSFRSGIDTQNEEGGEQFGDPIRVFIKVFSTLAVDTGADLLKSGILVNADLLTTLLAEQKENLINDEVLSSIVADTNGDAQITVEFV